MAQLEQMVDRPGQSLGGVGQHGLHAADRAVDGDDRLHLCELANAGIRKPGRGEDDAVNVTSGQMNGVAFDEHVLFGIDDEEP